MGHDLYALIWSVWPSKAFYFCALSSKKAVDALHLYGIL